MTRTVLVVKSVVNLALAATVLGVVAGLASSALLSAFEEAFKVSLTFTSPRARGGPALLLLMTGCVFGCAGHWWMERSTGVAGMSVVAPLAMLAGAATLGVEYMFGVAYLTLEPNHLFQLTLVPAFGLVISAIVREWLDQ